MTSPDEIDKFDNENFFFVIIDGEKHLLYMGDDTTDMTEASIQQAWSEEKSAWDDV